MLNHGGNLRQAARQYGIPLEAWCDLSTGINPNHYPIPNIPINAWHRLPEDNDELIDVACAYYHCQSLLPTAGSQAAIQILPKLRPTCHIAMPKNMYQEHAHAWQTNGHLVTFFDTTPNADILATVDVLLLCNPNNPTGIRFSKDQLLAWHQQLSSRHAWLIVDEAFMDNTPQDSIASETHLECLFVLRSLGKFFGLAGARVGFLLAQTKMLALAQEIIGPWSIAGPSRYIATHALRNHAWQNETRKTLSTNMQQLKQLLQQNGLTPSGGTDLFQYVVTPQAITFHQKLAKQGIWVRLFNQIPALRLGLPSDDHWNKLTKALEQIY